jgi:hypothetical protein
MSLMLFQLNGILYCVLCFQTSKYCWIRIRCLSVSGIRRTRILPGEMFTEFCLFRVLRLMVPLCHMWSANCCVLTTVCGTVKWYYSHFICEVQTVLCWQQSVAQSSGTTPTSYVKCKLFCVDNSLAQSSGTTPTSYVKCKLFCVDNSLWHIQVVLLPLHMWSANCSVLTTVCGTVKWYYSHFIFGNPPLSIYLWFHVSQGLAVSCNHFMKAVIFTCF